MLPKHFYGKIWPNSTQFSWGLFSFNLAICFGTPCVGCCTKPIFKMGVHHSEIFVAGWILFWEWRVVIWRRMAVDYGNVISSCRLAHSESGKSFNFYKMELFYLDHLSCDGQFLRLPQEVKCFDVQIRNPLIRSHKKCRWVCLFVRQAVWRVGTGGVAKNNSMSVIAKGF